MGKIDVVRWTLASLLVSMSIWCPAVCDSESLGVGGPKLSLPRALLPLGVDSRPLFLNVTATSSCYSWSSSREDAVGVTEVEDFKGCSTSARITIHPYITQRQTAIVFAQDLYTKQILRCDIIVDKIDHLKISTTTRELFVEEAPEVFEVRAYDDQDNEFTTLDGVEFSWSVVSNSKDGEVIRIITFSESSYEASDALKEMERTGKRSHTILLEGVSTGVANVFVKLPHMDYASVDSAQVTLRVVANLLIMPADVSIMPQDIVYFKIIQVREGRLIEIPQPSAQYWLEIEDTSIVDIDKSTGRAVGKKLGSTKVLLRDSSKGTDSETDAVRSPDANIRVVTPHSLQLELRPLPMSRVWSVECDTRFTLIVHILDGQRKRIFVGPETRVAVELNKSLVDVEWQSVNGTISNCMALQTGLLPVTAKLISVAGKTIQKDISISGEVNIVAKIRVIPPSSFIPLHSPNQLRSELQLSAEGGDGIYVWHADGPVSVDPRGSVTPNEIGYAYVFASMASNLHIYNNATVVISTPASLDIIWYEEEGPVGSDLSIHVALYGDLPPHHRAVSSFTHCNPRSFTLTSIEGIKFDLSNSDLKSDESPIGPSCTILRARCIESGTGLMNIQWGDLEAGLSLRCFDPLQSVFPAQHVPLILTVGSSHNIIFKGGPNMWFEGKSEKLHKIKSSDPAIARIVPYQSSPDYTQHIYTVTCLELGTSEAVLELYAKTNDDSSGSKSIKATVEVLCLKPHSLKLSLKQNISSLCPTASLSQLLALSGGEPVEVEVLIFDKNGRQFNNATSLRFKWSSKPSSVLPELPFERVVTKLDPRHSVPIVHYHYQVLRIFGDDATSKTGMGEINIETSGYRSAVLKMAEVQNFPALTVPLRALLSLKLITSVEVANKKITIINSPSNVVEILLSNGSGHFQISLSSGGYAKVTLEGRTLKITPYMDGDFTIAVTDLCVSNNALVLQVRVASIGSIITDIPELVEKGRSVACAVYFYDRVGLLLPTSVSGTPTLIAKVTEGHVNVVPSTVASEDRKGVVYNVTGLELGDANIEFTAGHVRGVAHTHVFPPLSLTPAHSVILPGGYVKIGVVGGPPPPAVIKFSSNVQSFEVIDVTDSGIVKGLDAGNALVEAHVEGFRGAELIHASASVKVVLLEGITIHAPTSSLLVNNRMPLWAMGIPDSITPMELGSLNPSLRFRWSISGDGVVSISDVLSDTEIEFYNTDRVTVRLTAILAGSVTVYLNVTASSGSVISHSRQHTWHAKFELTVVEPLSLVHPPYDVPQLLVAPHSEIQLQTNFPTERLTFGIAEDKTEKGTLLAKVSPDGKFTTFGRPGFGVIVIGTVESHLPKQHISVAFEICAPHYSMLQVDKKYTWNKLSGLGGLPSGLTLPLILNKYDIFGREITTSVSGINYHTNRPDLVLVAGNSTNTQEVLLFETGQAVIKLWDASSEKQFTDYIYLKILSAIYPQKITATVGDIWCMRNAIQGGSWYDNLSGTVWTASTGMVQAQASRVAATALIFKLSSGLPYITQANVIIRPADRIYFLDADNIHVVTDNKPYTISLVLANHEENKKFGNLILENNDCIVDNLKSFPFTCELRKKDEAFASNVEVVPVFNKMLGTYGCRVSWHPDTSLVFANVTQGVSVYARVGSIETESVLVRCIKSAVVQPDKVVLSPAPAYLAPVDIMGSYQVLKQVKLVSETDILSLEGPFVISDTNIRYVVKAVRKILGAQKFNLHFISPLTRQDVEIQISANGESPELSGTCELGGGSLILRLIEHNQMILLFIITCIAIFAASIYVYGNFIYPIQKRRTETTPNESSPFVDITSSIRNVTYQSRSPLSRSLNESFSPHESIVQHSPPSPQLDTSGSAIYGDPSYMAPLERRRNRRFI